MTYASVVMPANAPTVQFVECRRAFYAGARTLFILLMNGFDPGTEPTAADMKKLDALKQELDEFMEELKHGRA